MLFKQFLVWWYADGWLAVAESLGRRTRGLNEAFSVKALLRTLFAPWRRIISYPGASLQAKFQASMDNLFSRVVGFVVRIFVLLAAGLALVFITLATLVETPAWPLLPLAVIGFIIMAIVG